MTSWPLVPDWSWPGSKKPAFFEPLTISGQQVSAQMVVDSYPANHQGRLALAYFKAFCSLEGLCLLDQPIPPEVVARDFLAAGDRLGLVRFRQDWHQTGSGALFGALLPGRCTAARPVTPEAVLDVVENSRSQLARACFMTTCCLQNLHLHGKPVTTDMVLAQYPDNQADLEQAAYFKKTVLSQ